MHVFALENNIRCTKYLCAFSGTSIVPAQIIHTIFWSFAFFHINLRVWGPSCPSYRRSSSFTYRYCTHVNTHLCDIPAESKDDGWPDPVELPDLADHIHSHTFIRSFILTGIFFFFQTMCCSSMLWQDGWWPTVIASFSLWKKWTSCSVTGYSKAYSGYKSS